MSPLLAVLSPGHIILVVVVIVLLFGAAKIPELMRSMGLGIGEFKKGLKDSLKDEPEKEKEPAKTEEKK